MERGDRAEFVWQQRDWPAWRWDQPRVAALLADVSFRQGRLIGRMEDLGFRAREEAALRTLTDDVVTSSAIEGERLDALQVRSSVARRLGMDIGALTPADRRVEGVVGMTLDAIHGADRPLTEERILGWHRRLFPRGARPPAPLRVGGWRDDARGPMQIVSGPLGRERVHFRAPPARRVPEEMTAFLRWSESAEPPGSGVLKAGIAHLWFLTIHPFDDGNGRIGRALADLFLARAERGLPRAYSLSAEIHRQRQGYYEALERNQRGSLDATEWLAWFLQCLGSAVDGAAAGLDLVLCKAGFWRRHAGTSFNERQIKVLNRFLDGLEGKLTTSKWAKLGRCSQDTAWRDILDLLDRGVLKKDPAGGRSTSYSLPPA